MILASMRCEGDKVPILMVVGHSSPCGTACEKLPKII
jgi:hypothetical protein